MVADTIADSRREAAAAGVELTLVSEGDEHPEVKLYGPKCQVEQLLTKWGYTVDGETVADTMWTCPRCDVAMLAWQQDSHKDVCAPRCGCGGPKDHKGQCDNYLSEPPDPTDPRRC